MNICFPSLSYSVNGEPTSGVGSQVRLLAQALVDTGNDASVVDLARDQSSVLTDERGVKVYREPAGNFHWRLRKIPLIGKLLSLPVRELEYSIAVWRGVQKANHERPVDLIEGTETGMLLLAIFWKQSPVIIRLHGEQYTFHKYTPGLRLTAGVRLSRALQRVALRRAKLLISPSYAHAREISEELGTPHPPIVVVPNALAIERTNGHRATTPVANTVLYAGRIEQRKGIRTLLHAAAQTRAALPESRFIFAGDFHSSVSPAEFQSLVRKNNLENNVELLGPVDWASLKTLYRDSALAVLPSHYETFGLAALEPMAFGTPVVACNSSALPEVVIQDQTGKLVAPGDCGALAEAMIDLLSHPEARQRMSNSAIEHAARFDVRKLLPLNKQLYKWCIENSFASNAAHIFFSPHLDDVVLSCGGAIHSLLTQKKAVRVITVFAGDLNGKQSAFTRHLQRKWKLDGQVSLSRRDEDRKALRELGVKHVEHWDYLEAPYRRDAAGENLYGTYNELCDMAEADHSTINELTQRVLRNGFSQDAILYFPLSLGRHADHRILFEVGRNLHQQGFKIRFFEDFPYAEKYNAEATELNWLPRTVAIDLSAKAKASAAYTSQVIGLGGSSAALKKRLRAFASRIKSEGVVERYWQLAPYAAAHHTKNSATIDSPLNLRKCSPRLSDFKNFVRTFRWHDLGEMLAAGSGSCIDLGCGRGRHQSLIEDRGYKWTGFDQANRNARALCSASALPLTSETQAAVVAWQMLEYVERPDAVATEVARVLEPGGIFCGSVSFLEPVHGRTYYNLSPLILEKLLGQNGFADIEIKAGLNGFALMLWTWLRRTRIPLADQFAIPVAYLMFVPIALFLFGGSWLSRSLGFGDGHFMRWLSQTAPVEFAGHVMFSARKKVRR